MTRDDYRRQARDLWRAIARALDAKGDAAGAKSARWRAKQMGEPVRQLGALGRASTYGQRGEDTGRWRRRA